MIGGWYPGITATYEENNRRRFTDLFMQTKLRTGSDRVIVWG